MTCPKCGGELVLEDKVLFCEECLHTVSRNYRKQLEPKSRRRPGLSEKRQVGIVAMMIRWEPGKIVSHSPKGIRGTIVMAKNGNLSYRYKRHEHRSSVMRKHGKTRNHT